MIDFFKTQIDFILFFYGLTSIMLAGACFTMGQPERKSFPWNRLGFFGIAFGLNQWLDLIIKTFGESFLFTFFHFFLLTTSLVFLIDFGRTGLFRLKGKGPGGGSLYPY